MVRLRHHARLGPRQPGQPARGEGVQVLAPGCCCGRRSAAAAEAAAVAAGAGMRIPGTRIALHVASQFSACCDAAALTRSPARPARSQACPQPGLPAAKRPAIVGDAAHAPHLSGDRWNK